MLRLLGRLQWLARPASLSHFLAGAYQAADFAEGKMTRGLSRSIAYVAMFSRPRRCRVLDDSMSRRRPGAPKVRLQLLAAATCCEQCTHPFHSPPAPRPCALWAGHANWTPTSVIRTNAEAAANRENRENHRMMQLGHPVPRRCLRPPPPPRLHQEPPSVGGRQRLVVGLWLIPSTLVGDRLTAVDGQLMVRAG